MAKQEKAAETPETGVPRLQEYYHGTVRPALAKDLAKTNPHAIPRLEKIVVNMGVGGAAQQAKQLDGALADLEVITGQKPLVTRARKSISNFKLREGQAIGTKVTLRGDRMWEFLDRLIAVAIPRIRDFRGLPAHSWDGQGNYTFGLNEQTMFAEIDPDKVNDQRGMDITIVTTATTNEAGYALLDAFGFPFKKGADADNAPRKKRRKRPLYGKKSK